MEDHYKCQIPDRGGDTPLGPYYKWRVLTTLRDVLTKEGHADTEIHWYLSEVLNRADTPHLLYHYLPKPLHSFVSVYVANPSTPEPKGVAELKSKHPEAQELIAIRMTEKLLED